MFEKSPYFAYLQAMNILGASPHGEKAVATDPWYSYNYARDVLGGPFPKGEAAIATDLGCSYNYAFHVLKEPFPQGEEVIAKDSYFSYLYALDVIKGPFPLGEAAIAKDAWYSYKYAKDVLKGPFPLGEAEIAKSAQHSCIAIAKYIDLAWDYCLNVAKQPSTAIEEVFAKHPGFALSYAVDILKGPFLLGEKAIFNSPRVAEKYKRFLNDSHSYVRIPSRPRCSEGAISGG